MDKNLVWISWETHVRNRTLSSRLNARLIELDIKNVSRWVRYLKSSLLTVKLLWRWRGQVVVTQNPSMVLCLLAVIFRPLLRFRLIVDAHNAGIYPGDREQGFRVILANFIIRNSDLVFVTNQALALRVEQVGGSYTILPDPIPLLDSHGINPKFIRDDYRYRVAFICTWAADEPYLEVFKAAELLPDIQFFVTGNSKGRDSSFGRKLPSNVALTGFLPEDEYHQLLFSVGAIIDLTTRENCLVCGAYEAVAVGKPFLLSDTAALRHYFRKGGEYAFNNATAIAAGTRALFNDYPRYLAEITEFKPALDDEWQQYLASAQQKIAIL